MFFPLFSNKYYDASLHISIFNRIAYRSLLYLIKSGKICAMEAKPPTIAFYARGAVNDRTMIAKLP